jgi:hypothetical protein
MSVGYNYKAEQKQEKIDIVEDLFNKVFLLKKNDYYIVVS